MSIWLGSEVVVRIKLKGLAKARKRLASGEYKEYYYAWRGGPAIDRVPGTPEFIVAYNRAVSARRLPRNDNLGSLIDRYEDSEEFRSCRPKTKKDYCRLLTSIRGKFGDLPIKLFKRQTCSGRHSGMA
jgi:hypothetical protein